MRLRSLARVLVIGALAAFALLWVASTAMAQEADATAVQGQNGSSDGTAVSGNADGANTAAVGAGPAATSGGTSMSQQNGNNSVTVRQTSTAKSGDAVAGSQVTGVVGGDATIQNQNSSSGSTAISGNATASNTAVVNAGPTSSSTAGAAQSAQQGDNAVRVLQDADAQSGDSVAGSQVTGAVGDAITVQGQNHSEDAFSFSGDADATNLAFVAAGPSADATEIFGDAEAQAGQIGDNDVVLRQSSSAATGDSLAGSVVTGIVGDDDATATSQNSSEDSVAFSGNAFADNLAIVTAGPAATASSIFGDATSQSAQQGDNGVIADQESGAVSGDALAGSQVVGLVSSETGSLQVQNQQSSDSDFASSGDAIALNDAFVGAGPVATATSTFGNVEAQASQDGDNDMITSQSATAASGDALAGSGVTGVVGGSDVTILNQNHADGPTALSGTAVAINTATTFAGPAATVTSVFGDATAQSSQTGDNFSDVSQDVSAVTGDALAGSQVTGVVTDGGDVTIQNQNNSENALALSGAAVGLNDLFVAAGPVATASSIFGDTNAQASQTGDTSLVFSQDLNAGSGDAVAGSQVTGVVGDEDSTIAGQNVDDSSTALSGAVDGLNLATGTLGATAAATSVTGTAAAQQSGDSDLLARQDLDLSSGDAVVGSQVVGRVGI